MNSSELQKFCEPDCTPHDWMRSPFFIPNWNGAYATDGRIIIWSKDRLNIENNLAELTTAQKFVQMKSILRPIQVLIDQSECVNEVCTITKPLWLNDRWRLDLSQYFVSFGDYDMPIEYVEHKEASQVVALCGMHFQKLYVWMIGTLPNVRCQANLDHDSLVFKFDGGAGALKRALTKKEQEERN